MFGSVLVFVLLNMKSFGFGDMFYIRTKLQSARHSHKQTKHSHSTEESQKQTKHKHAKWTVYGGVVTNTVFFCKWLLSPYKMQQLCRNTIMVERDAIKKLPLARWTENIINWGLPKRLPKSSYTFTSVVDKDTAYCIINYSRQELSVSLFIMLKLLLLID
jgi:hypothetical protein